MSNSWNNMKFAAEGIYYHVAPVAVRNQIQSEGLTPWNAEREYTFYHFEPKPLVYLWSDIAKAHEWADTFADMYPDPPHSDFPDEASMGQLPVADIWEVRANLNLEQDVRVDGGLTTDQAIPPASLRIIDTYSISDMTKYRDRECPSCGGDWDAKNDLCPECDPPESDT
jgi:hypothetical protein